MNQETDMLAQAHRFRPTVLQSLLTRRAQVRDRPREADGLVRVRSAHSVDQTIDRLRNAIAAKGIPFFGAIDQARMAADAGITLRPSTLLVFGTPSLGAHFLNSNPYAGLDWPIRLLVVQDSTGAVWVAYTDFAWTARRRGISNLRDLTALAAAVVDSIAATVRVRPLWSSLAAA
jgi:uncharacterized protein (DUF302 family)